MSAASVDRDMALAQFGERKTPPVLVTSFEFESGGRGKFVELRRREVANGPCAYVNVTVSQFFDVPTPDRLGLRIVIRRRDHFAFALYPGLRERPVGNRTGIGGNECLDDESTSGRKNRRGFGETGRLRFLRIEIEERVEGAEDEWVTPGRKPPRVGSKDQNVR